MNVGALSIDGLAALAPMAGVADRSMRELCRAYGAAMVVGELASSRGICLNDKKSEELLSVFPGERPMGVQLFGNDPAIMAEAARRAMAYTPEFIDINMGCPAPKVAMNGGGSALMKEPPLAAEIVRHVANAVPVPVTVKIRTGWDGQHLNAVELAKRCEAAGAQMITVHGRTREQGYAPPADLVTIGKVKRAVSVPVVGNGDITTPEAAAEMLEQTGCDMIMVGRAACGAPWIFAQINAFLKDGTRLPAPPVSERMRVMVEHIRHMKEYKGEHIAMLQARKHCAFYMRGIAGAAGLRRECGQISCMEQVEELAWRVCLQAKAFGKEE